MTATSRPVLLATLAAVLLLGGCSLSRNLSSMDDPDDYEAYAKKWAPSEDAFIAVQRLAKPYIDKRDWEGAASLFARYAPSFPGMEKRFAEIDRVLRAPTANLEVKNLGTGINSPANEIKPSMTADGTRLYFASDREGGRGELDVYVSKFENGAWQPAQNLGERINTPDHETINGISFDGTMILLYGGFTGHRGGGDNFYFEKTERGWSPIQHIPAPVNGITWDSDAFTTADGKAMLFTSDRAGVIGKVVPKGTKFHGSEAGNSDIWVSVRRGKQWLPPMNLGPKINTPFCERSAFLHPDGKTLYFSSDGHPGLGKLDVFRSVRLREDSWTEWSEPVNVGKEINTSEDDWGYKVSTDGKTAVFSSSELPGGSGQNDIYLIDLPTAAQPASEVATITGRILDENGNPVGATIRWGNLETGTEEGEVQSDPQTGEYVVTLPLDKLHELIFLREGYYPSSTSIDLRRNGANNGRNGNDPNGRNGNDPNGRNNGNDPNGRNGAGTGDPNDPNNRNGNNDPRNFAVDIKLTSVESLKSKRDKYGELLAQRVNNIFFDFAKWELRPESNYELERLRLFLESNPDIRIQIGAHTDDVGSDDFNMNLSLKRAQSVVDYIIAKGISKGRLLAKGYGETRPEVANDTEENRARNRRVEFRIAE